MSEILTNTAHKIEKVLNAIELKIDKHFAKVDADKTTSRPECLTVYKMCLVLMEEFQLRSQECAALISLYVDEHPTLEIRQGAEGGIYRKTDPKNYSTMKVEECALQHYSEVAQIAGSVIDNEFEKVRTKLKEKGIESVIRLPVQELAQLIADRVGIKRYAAYHCMVAYINRERRNDLSIVRGKYGGVEKTARGIV